MVLARRPCGGLGFGVSAVLVVYVLAAALLPLGHHDVACHLKSPTHCTTCVIGSSAELTPDVTTLLRQPLRDAGRAAAMAVTDGDTPVPRTSSGRSPPLAA
jgi:hypothetical protein